MSKLDSVQRNLSINSKENTLLLESDEKSEDRYVVCDNCDEKIDCWNNNRKRRDRRHPKSSAPRDRTSARASAKSSRK